jgi:NO-binding membrane sensor protein with MHYT domain
MKKAPADYQRRYHTALWMALRLDSVWSTFIASLVAGVAVNGMHDTGMATSQPDVIVEPGAERPGRSEK